MSAKDDNGSSAAVDITMTTKPPPSFYSTSVFGNKSIFKRIMEYLEPNDVLNCRLVNRKWNRLTTNYLRTEPSTQHRFEMKIQRETVVDLSYACKKRTPLPYRDRFGFRYWPKFQTLLEFVECIKSSKLGYWTSFSVKLNACANEEDVKLLSLFSSYGSSIKTLKLQCWDSGDNNVGADQLVTILEFVQSSLEELTLNDAPNYCPPSLANLCAFDFKLPKLKVLTASIREVNTEYFQMFFKAAVNLKEFKTKDQDEGQDGIPLDKKYCQVFMDQNKLKVIKQAEINLANEENFNFIKRLCLPRYSDLKLELLTVKYGNWYTRDEDSDSLSNPNTASILSTILNNQKQNIQELNFKIRLNKLHCLKFTFQLLQILHLLIETKQFDPQEELKPVFPKDFDFQLTFPNLVELHIKLSPEANTIKSEASTRTIAEVLLGVDKKQQQFKNIKRLVVSGYEESIWVVKQALLVFPSLTSIHWSINYVLSLPKFLQKTISLMPKQVLERIKSLEFEDLIVNEEDAFPVFDSLFTGFSEETCKSLFGLKLEFLDTLTVSQIDELRVNPSLMSFLNLEMLHLNVDGRPKFVKQGGTIWSGEVPDFMDNLITHLSRDYCFRQIKGLKVKETITIFDDYYYLLPDLQHHYDDIYFGG